jgi:hypothetical protein
LGYALVMAATALSGCTTRAWFDGLQMRARQSCQTQPDAERARCEARLPAPDFARYEQQRGVK